MKRSSWSSIAVGIVLFVAACIVPVAASDAADTVEFESASFTIPLSPFKIRQAKKQGIEITPKVHPSVNLTGAIDVPPGDGPFPAVVLLHGCAGISEWNRIWTARLVGWGYAVLNVDSFNPRGLTYTCDSDSGTATMWDRALDAFGAKRFLSTLDNVDASRIAVMGMSHGGGAVLHAIERAMATGTQQSPFAAAVALYPVCRVMKQVDTPTRIFIGEADQWTPAAWCVRYVDALAKPHDVGLKVYPDAHHVFDVKGINGTAHGLAMRYDAAADAETIETVRQFLTRLLR